MRRTTDLCICLGVEERMGVRVVDHHTHPGRCAVAGNARLQREGDADRAIEEEDFLRSRRSRVDETGMGL